MRLNKTHCSDFVALAMQDVPKTDFETPFKALVMEDMLAQAPAEMKPLLQKESLRMYVLHPYDAVNIPARNAVGMKTSVHWVQRESTAVYKGFKVSSGTQTKINTLAVQMYEEHDARAALEAKLLAAISGCTTLKKAHELLPEFKKYLPTEQVRDSTLPAIANLTADLVKMGWPDGGKKKEPSEHSA